MLFKYDVLTKSDSYNVFRMLQSNNFEDGVEYALAVEGIDDGRREKKNYMLTADVFKMLCMRSLKTKKYSHYYILLEKAVKYYNDYQLLKLQNKIDKLENTLENRVIPPSCKSKIENLAIVYLGEEEEEELEFQYYVIRGQRQHIMKQLRRLNKTEDAIIASIETPNSVDLWINIKDELDEHLKLDKLVVNNKIMNTGYFQLQGISEKEFIRRINQINLKSIDIK